MTFDLYGENPISKIGSCYRINIWKWHELWKFIEFLDSDLVLNIKFWYTNDMELVNSKISIAIYDMLISKLSDYSISNRLTDFHSQYGKMSYMFIPGYRPLSEIDIEVFCLFLKDCGGFRIG